MKLDLRHGDCLEVLKTIPDNSIDSIVTDPPYHLTSIVKRFGKEGSAPAQYGTDGAFSRATKGFMGKTWDGGDIAQRPDVWIECIRVLKPGGHLLAFSGSRTYHRMAVAIEDAGFEIRDQIMWIYGSGFPKSLNVGKAIDKLQGNEREVVGEVTTQFKIDNYEQTIYGKYNPVMNENGYRVQEVTKGNSVGEGWGTALKPAHEPIVVARKPLSEKSVAENVLKWGTGGLNIDESRVPFEDTPNAATNPLYRQQNDYKMPEKGQESNGATNFTSGKNDVNNLGRWPANIILDEEAGQILDEQFDSASRFFYCPKTSKKDRDEGLDMFNDVIKTDGRKEQGKSLVAMPQLKNFHPTVKPTSLMEYLIKLVTPVGGTVLDPFMGSGSTGKASVRNNFNFVGIEREKEYIDIATARINNELKDK